MTFLMTPQFYRVLIIVVLCTHACAPVGKVDEMSSGWPAVSREAKPWTRWWWHGNALTKEGITAEMEAYQRAGIGGLEITPIYGVYGDEEKFIDFLSPGFMSLLDHVLKEGDRLDLGIDMATGTGWPFGGPWVSADDACKNIQHRIYQLKGGERLAEKIEFIQQPYLRLVGNNIYQPDPTAPLRVMNTSGVTIGDIADPVAANKDLQRLAIDQVQFEKSLQLKCLMAYSTDQVLDLTNKVDPHGNLDWIAPEGNWRLYAVFEGFHGKMVERAGPGGEGNVIDHFSETALNNYLKRFDEVLNDHDITALRAFFNDSYEVDDARGAADFTPELFAEFIRRRGYDLRNELPALFGKETPEKNARVLCDYRETLSDLLLENFTMRWKEWGKKHNAIVRNQAHGAPSNILDLYAAVDIPEIEGDDPLRFKMATSSGNVSGKRLISAESATWLNEHFESNLADVKEALDAFMLQGVNHLIYHGTCYSPSDEAWPGRLFYAAVHLNPRNPLWRDFDALNAYVTRCQSFLQNTASDNDVLLYYPIYDRFSSPGPEMVEHFDGIGTFAGSGFETCAREMLAKGFSFDYISDRQLQEAESQNGLLKTSGAATYKMIVVPECHFMPLKTMEKLSTLASAGVRVFFQGNMPEGAGGYHELEENSARFQTIVSKMRSRFENDPSGGIRIGDDLVSMLVSGGARRESMFDSGIQCLRKKNRSGDLVYFLKNVSGKYFEGWLSLPADLNKTVLYDPMTGKSGRARSKNSGRETEVFVHLERGQTLLLQSGDQTFADFSYRKKTGESFVLDGQWKTRFDSGGPALPPSFERDSLVYWTDLKDDSYQNFSGTATYELSFRFPGKTSGRWLLQLDSVKESAEIILNGKSVGTAIGPVYQIEIDDGVLDTENILQIKVSNLMANRIAYMDRSNIFWKKFYNVNFPARRRENSRDNIFDASHWESRPSGISGTAVLHRLQ